MNNFILMAEVVQDPQLRYTSDTQTPIAELMVQFEGLRDDDPPETLKVVGWGNLAQEIQERYRPGDRLVIEGRLNMNTVERPEGFREKRAELTAQRIHLLGRGEGSGIVSTVASAPTSTETPRRTAPTAAPSAPVASAPVSSSPTVTEADYDDIPF
ncbi:MAG: single-stranded DNA-binding protein [Synechococcales bacterium]|nr:single-stranded DNA-binding protein [Synechococcales bacterium]